MRKVAAAVGGSLAVSCHTTLAPQSVPILLTGFKAERPGLIEGHHLGDQYDLLGLSVDGWGRTSACPTRTSTSWESGRSRSLRPMCPGAGSERNYVTGVSRPVG